MWSECAWLSATASRWRMPRDHSAARDHLLADVEVLRGLARAAAEAAAIDQQGLAVGRNQQQGVALAHVDGFHQQRVAGVLDRARQHRSQSGQQQRGPGKRRCQRAPEPTAQAGQHDGRAEQRAKGRRLPEQRRGNAEVAQGQRAEERAPARCRSGGASATTMAGITAAAGHTSSNAAT